MTLKELRKTKRLTQQQCADYLGLPVRTYQNYERPQADQKSFKYLYMFSKLQQYGHVDETHGLLSVDEIKRICADVFSAYNVAYAYLFGSYAKGHAGEASDVDLFVSTSETGFRFFGMVEELRQQLRKKVDVLDAAQLNDNPALANEILRDGVKIYG